MAVFTQVSRRPVAFVLPVMGLMGALVGLFVGPAFGSAVVGIVFGDAFDDPCLRDHCN